MVYVQTRILSDEWDKQIFLGFWNAKESPNLLPEDLVLFKKKSQSIGFYRSVGQQNKNKRKRKGRKILRPCQRTEENVEHKGDWDFNCNWWT